MFALLDIGGTQIKYSILDSATEEIVFSNKLATATAEPNFNMLDRIATILNQLAAVHKLEGAAISTAGTIDPDEGKVIYANPNIPHYTGCEIKAFVEQEYGIPCEVENDVNCALLGEVHYGGHTNLEHALMLTIGTGVGGALLINGEIYHGAFQGAGEIGYSFYNRQNIEQQVSTVALVQKVQNRLPQTQWNGFKIFEAAKAGNQICIEAIEELVADLTTIIINYASLINPQVVFLGGGIMEQSDYLAPLFDHYFNVLYTNELMKDKIKIQFAKLGNRSGMLGAWINYKKLQGIG